MQTCPHKHQLCDERGSSMARDRTGTAIACLDGQVNELARAHTHTPVDGAAIDEGGELAQPLPECVPDGRQAQHNVQVLAGHVQEEVPNLHLQVRTCTAVFTRWAG